MTSGGHGVGDSIGGYRLIAVLGHGGVGTVYRARGADDATVAVKMLHSQLSDDELFVRRFDRELRTASLVRHRHCVEVIGGGLEDGCPYLVMPLIEGGTLAARVRRDGALEVADVIRIVGQLAAAVDAMHGFDLVHRDIKPANVLLSDNRGAMLTDFGLARGVAETVLSRTGVMSGTADYVAPELILGGDADASSDIYSLACLTYAALDGGPPFARRSPAELLRAHLEVVPDPPGAWREDVPGAVGEVVLHGLEKAPASRPRTATAFARQLEIAAREG